MGTWGLDIFAGIFALPVPRNVNVDTPDSGHLDDPMIEDLIQQPVARAWDKYLRPFMVFSSPSVPTYRIDDKLIVKRRNTGEIENMLYVRQHTTIPVPQPRFKHLPVHMVMDFIEGKMLLDCWNSLNVFMQFRIACTLRGYVSQLRRLRGTVPGAVGCGTLRGVLFDDQNIGPFSSSTRFRQFCEQVSHYGWTEYAGRRRDSGTLSDLLPPPPFGHNWPICFTHSDLNPSNVILSSDGTLWIVDWANSGFFPPWMESIGFLYCDAAPASWQRYRWFIAGTCPQYEYLWALFADNVHRFINHS